MWCRSFFLAYTSVWSGICVPGIRCYYRLCVSTLGVDGDGGLGGGGGVVLLVMVVVIFVSVVVV